MSREIAKVQQRAVQYWFIDGLAEIGIAATCILLAALFWAYPMMPVTPWRDLVFFAVVFAGSFGLRWIVQRVKEKETYPRTGYVANKSGWGNKRAVAGMVIFTVLILALQFYLALQGNTALTWMPVTGGVILAFIFALISYQAGLMRFLFLTIFTLLASGALLVSGLGDYHATAVLVALVGLALLILGIRTRRIYYRENSAPKQ